MNKIIIGIDEAGRGAWAGPIVAAAVYFKKPFSHKYLKDSKLLSARKRQELFDLLSQHCEIGIGVVSHKYIDKHGLQKANVLVAERALKELTSAYCLLPTSYKLVLDYIGGFQKITKLKQNYSLHKHGESKFKEIAAASIIAKVYRDSLMKKYSKIYPNYGFDQHKGYGTLIHQQCLRTNGTCAIHRLSFAPISQEILNKKKRAATGVEALQSGARRLAVAAERDSSRNS